MMQIQRLDVIETHSQRVLARLRRNVTELSYTVEANLLISTSNNTETLVGGVNRKSKKKDAKWTPFVSEHARAMDTLPDKAGVFVVGEVKEKDNKQRDIMRTYIVAPYVVGKYTSDTQKFYTLPKGGVENTSDRVVREGALKEVHEETGIDAKNILADPSRQNKGSRTDQAIEEEIAKGSNRSKEQMIAEKAPHEWNHYEGVSRLEKEGDIADFATITYPSKAGIVHKLRMYALWVDGIEHLKGKTKGQSEFMGEDGAAQTLKTAVERAEAEGLPSEAEMIQALRTGRLRKTPVHVEEKAGYEQKTEALFDDAPVLTKLRGSWNVFALRKYGEARPLDTPDAIAEALEYFPEYREPLTKQIKTLRKELEARGSISDERGVKLEDNIRPCAWIAEGADVIPLETYIDRIHEKARDAAQKIDEQTEYTPLKAYDEAWFKQRGHRCAGEEKIDCPDKIQHPEVKTDGEAMVLAPFVGRKGLPANMKSHIGAMSGMTHLGKLNKKARKERREEGGSDVVSVFIQDEAQKAESKRVRGKISDMLGEMPEMSDKVLARKDRILLERESQGMSDDGRGVA